MIRKMQARLNGMRNGNDMAGKTEKTLKRVL